MRRGIVLGTCYARDRACVKHYLELEDTYRDRDSPSLSTDSGRAPIPVENRGSDRSRHIEASAIDVFSSCPACPPAYLLLINGKHLPQLLRFDPIECPISDSAHI